MFRIGRHSGNDFVLSDRAGEEFHCEIHQLDGEYWIEDKQTRYGTLVNGKRIDKTRLNSGDELQIGFTRLEWEELLGLEKRIEIVSATQAEEKPLTDLVSAPDVVTIEIQAPEIVFPELRNPEDTSEQKPASVAAQFSTNPYVENLAPSLAYSAFERIEKVETDIPASLIQPEINEDCELKIVPEKSATMQPVQNIPKKVKRELNQDERLILSTIAIMVLMMLGGLLLGYATMD